MDANLDREQNGAVNPVDSRIFWLSLYVTPAIWILLGIVAVFRLYFSWIVVVVVALVFNMANVIGYMKCQKDARQKVTNYIAGTSWFQSIMGSFISERVGSFFGGSAPQSQSRV
ncbi:Golgi apparatus membrane protein TVP23 A [Irineochytrium annulatum]|nr:Golgi apparatus membrane protein TVP23 A [Irineochytrium annulatum]